MKLHVKIYFTYFGYDESDTIICECCQRSRAVDIHHIDARGMGSSSNLDYVENLMALCRRCHVKYGDKEQYMNFLKERHVDIMNSKNDDFKRIL